MGKGELTRAAIVAQAADVAARSGLAGLTIGDLAARAEMSKSGLFAHFRSKQELQLQVLAHARERFVAQVVRPALAEPRGEPRVRRLFEGWLACGRTGGPCWLFVSATMEYDDQPGPIRNHLVSAHRDLTESIAQMVRAGVAEGQFRADADPEQFAQDLYGAMLGYAYAYRLLADPGAEGRTLIAFERLLAGIRSSTAPG